MDTVFTKCRFCEKEFVNSSGCCLSCGAFQGYTKPDVTPKFWAPLIDKEVKE